VGSAGGENEGLFLTGGTIRKGLTETITLGLGAEGTVETGTFETAGKAVVAAVG